MTTSKVKLAIAGSLGAMAFAGLGMGAGMAMAGQPHMQRALVALNAD